MTTERFDRVYGWDKGGLVSVSAASRGGLTREEKALRQSNASAYY